MDQLRGGGAEREAQVRRARRAGDQGKRGPKLALDDRALHGKAVRAAQRRRCLGQDPLRGRPARRPRVRRRGRGRRTRRRARTGTVRRLWRPGPTSRDQHRAAHQQPTAASSHHHAEGGTPPSSTSRLAHRVPRVGYAPQTKLRLISRPVRRGSRRGRRLAIPSRSPRGSRRSRCRAARGTRRVAAVGGAERAGGGPAAAGRRGPGRHHAGHGRVQGWLVVHVRRGDRPAGASVRARDRDRRGRPEGRAGHRGPVRPRRGDDPRRRGAAPRGRGSPSRTSSTRPPTPTARNRAT